MSYMHPDQLYALVQEQHYDLLQEADQARAAGQIRRVRPAIVHWAGAQLMGLGLRWQGYNPSAQPVVICGGILCQQLTSPSPSRGDGCVSPV